jgi:hypothetical protein
VAGKRQFIMPARLRAPTPRFIASLPRTKKPFRHALAAAGTGRLDDEKPMPRTTRAPAVSEDHRKRPGADRLARAWDL